MRHVILIGPLPPPFGGARVSFRMFFDFLSDTEAGNRIVHFDLPVRHARDSVPAGGVSHWHTLRGLMRAAGRLPGADRVIIFGSRNFCFSYGLGLLMLSRIFRTPACIRFFGGHPALALQGKGPLRLLAMKLLGLAETIVVETAVAVTEFPEFLTDRVEVVHAYRITQPSEASRPTAPSGSHPVRFVSAGHLTREKGIPTLVSAFQILKEVQTVGTPPELHVYGSGETGLVDLLSSVPGIHYHGRVAQDELVGQLSSYDAFVFPSAYSNEGHPGAVVEALVVGLPIIATDLPGPLEILSDGVNAIIVETDNPSALASAMATLAADSELRSQLAEGASRSGRQFDADVVLPELAEALGVTKPRRDST